MKGPLPKLTSPRAAAQLAIIQSARSILFRSILVILTVELFEQLLLETEQTLSRPWMVLARGLLAAVLALPVMYRVILGPVASLAAEQAAASAEARFQAIAQAVQDGIIIFNEKCKILFANRAAEQMRGFSCGGLLGADMEILMPEERRGRFQASIRSYLTGDGATLVGKGVVEAEGLRTNGQRFPIELSSDPLVADRETQFVAVLRDITERKRAEATVRASENRYRGLFENCPISLWEEDFSEVRKHIDGLRSLGVEDFEAYFASHPDEVRECATRVKVMDVNEATLSLFEASNKDCLRQGLHVIFTESSYGAFREELIVLAKGETGFETETIAQTTTGVTKHLFVKWSVVPGYWDTLGRVVVSVVDITERKQAEKKLRERTARLDALIENSPLGIVVLDEQQRIQMCNPTFERLFSFSEAEIVGTDLDRLIATPDLLTEARQLTERGLQGVVGHAITRRRRKDGTLIDVEIHGVPLLVGGEVIGSYAFYQDQTERKRLEMYEQILPVCCVCGKIRDDSRTQRGHGPWEKLERYVAEHSDTQFSHTFCPNCYEEYRRKAGLA